MPLDEESGPSFTEIRFPPDPFAPAPNIRRPGSPRRIRWCYHSCVAGPVTGGPMRAWLALLLVALVQEPPEALRLPDTEFARRRAALLERFPDDAALALDAGPLG